jgi:ankyrin repeat protein
MGGGAVYVTSLVVDGVELFDRGIQFNWSCLGSDRPIVKIQVRATGSKVTLEECTGKGIFSDDSKSQPICSTKIFDIDTIAAANAKIDHQLADPKTQKSQSTKHLPPENDLAQVFAYSNPVPLCAHWSALFLDAITAPDRQRHGRIAGVEGERIYMHLANPQLCKNSDDDGCSPKSYLIPGDRVDIGFICGDWTLVQYESRARSKPHIKGWVETSRLYNVDSVSVPRVSNLGVITKQMAKDDPLVQAVADKNINKIKRLVAAGTNLDGVKKAGEPLAAAIETGDVDIVKLMLQLGANVNAKYSTGFGKCRILTLGVENQQIFEVLVKAGIDLNCNGGFWDSTPLMNIAQYNRVWAWERIHYGDRASGERLKDPIQLAKRLLAVGADPNFRDGNGRTALYYAMEANNIDIAKLLLDSGADPNISIDSYKTSLGNQLGSTPLMEAFHWYSLTLDPTMFELLLDRGANSNYRNQNAYNEELDRTTSGAVTFGGQTVLTRAAEDGYYTLARIALEHGADTTITRKDGKLAEEIANEFKHPKIAALIAAYANKRPDNAALPKAIKLNK